MTRHFASTNEFAAATTGGFLLAEAAVARLLLTVDGGRVSLMGRPIDVVCWLNSHYGLPCPTCGMSRSIVMTLHGRFGEAWSLWPAGPAGIVGLLLFAVALIVSAAFPAVVSSRRVRELALLYAAATVLIWVCGWTIRFSAALQLR